MEIDRTRTNGFLLVCTIALGFLLSSCMDAGQNILTEQEKADGWELLFDGKTLDGWRDYNGTALTGPWEVVDGAIQADGRGSDASGYIVTDKQYENFELSWDWKISKGGNSGMLYHVVERPQFAVPYVTGPEYQLLDDANITEPLEEWQRCGVDYAMYLPDFSKIKVKPAGEWNTSKIVFDNGHVTYFMNGEKTIEFDAWTDDWFSRKNSGKWANAPEYGLARKGVFCLQDHGYPAWFRNIKVKELPRKSKEVDLFNEVDLAGWDKYGTELWYVKDGLLICASGPDKQYGYLATREYYDDFDLTVEFKQEADGNSGIFIRSFVEPDVKVNGWQVEVAPKGQDTGGIYESYGRGWLIQIPDEKEDILKYGDWNTMRIKVQGDNVQTWLNGEEMVNIRDEKIGAGQGRIALQIHDGGGIKVLWRNLHLKTL
ncbi:3-keto-disaccharide hydrolase [Parabacteroides provencensis]|uniref:3-keto-disaccharide hydrolase n=1 Tax=Parabacteroides provencensis TaxID=1944636 RepID=UPI000C1471A0